LPRRLVEAARRVVLRGRADRLQRTGVSIMPSTRRIIDSCLLFGALALASAPAAAQKADAAGGAGAPSTVVATQGSTIVTLSDVDAFANRIPDKDRPGFFDSPNRLETLITQILLQKQLADEARKQGLDQKPTVRDEIQMQTDEVLSRARMEQFKADLKLPDFEELAREQYIGHKKTYVVPGIVSVQQIVISSGQRNDKDAKALADTVAEEARAHPDRFDALVEKYSEDENKATSKGVLKDVTKAATTPAFLGAVKRLKKVGDISEPAKVREGYAVIKLVSRAPDKQQSFAEVHDSIVDQLKSEYVAKAAQTHVDEIRNQKIDANPEMIASLRMRYGSAPPPAGMAPASAAPAQKP
jgi:peptidyl-prolyl cis-trans isomerase C